MYLTNFTSVQLHSKSLITAVHSFTTAQLHNYTNAQLHNSTAIQLHNARLYTTHCTTTKQQNWTLHTEKLFNCTSKQCILMLYKQHICTVTELHNCTTDHCTLYTVYLRNDTYAQLHTSKGWASQLDTACYALHTCTTVLCISAQFHNAQQTVNFPGQRIKTQFVCLCLLINFSLDSTTPHTIPPLLKLVLILI